MQQSTEGKGGGRIPLGGLLVIAALIVITGTSLSLEMPLAVQRAEAGRIGPDPIAVLVPGGARSAGLNLPDEALLGFVEIPGGPFLMGSDPAVDPLAYANEGWVDGARRREVEVPTFYIGRYEVTVAQYAAFVNATGRNADPAALSGPADHPVTSVSWPDAIAYARWLGAELRGRAQTPRELADRLEAGWRVTLPSEAEWEKAARGTDGRIYPWGDTPRRDHAHFLAAGAAPVGSVACDACAYGLSDMSGNVWEWTRSPYDDRGHGVALDAIDLEADALWVMRGGSFADNEQLVRAGVRGGGDPGVRRPFIGFRVALVPPSPNPSNP